MLAMLMLGCKYQYARQQMDQFKETYAMNYTIHYETTSNETIMAMSSNEKRGSGGSSHLRVHQKENSTTSILELTSEDSSLNGTTNPHSHNAQPSRSELLNPSSSSEHQYNSSEQKQETKRIQQQPPQQVTDKNSTDFNLSTTFFDDNHNEESRSPNDAPGTTSNETKTIQEVKVHDLIPEKMRAVVLDLSPDESKVTEQLEMKPLPQMRQCHASRVKMNDLSGRCCLGAFSVGAHQSFNGGNESCLQTLSDYNRVRDFAMDELSFNPVYGRTNSNRAHQNETSYADGRVSMLDCDVCRIIQIASTLKHKRIAIAGDSLQRQLFDGMECELFRRGFNMSEWTQELWPEDPPDQNHTGWKYGVGSKECFNVTLPDWMRSHRHNQSDHVEICTYGHYRPYPGMVQHQKIVNSSDIMLIDYGLHFLMDAPKEKDEYRSSIKDLINLMKKTPDCKIIYRETTAQHFDREGDGEFSFKDREKTGSCVPHYGNSSILLGITPRRNLLYEAAESQGYSVVDPHGNTLFSSNSSIPGQEMAFIPFWNFTSKLSFLHPNNKDCSHFCYTPHLWYSTWRHLRNVLERLVEAKETKLI